MHGGQCIDALQLQYQLSFHQQIDSVTKVDLLPLVFNGEMFLSIELYPTLLQFMGLTLFIVRL